jgi:hypothetical protein
MHRRSTGRAVLTKPNPKRSQGGTEVSPEKDSGQGGRRQKMEMRRPNINDAAGYLNDRHPALQYGASRPTIRSDKRAFRISEECL